MERGRARTAAGVFDGSVPDSRSPEVASGGGTLPGRRLLLTGACAGFVLNGLTFAIVGPTLIAISDSFHISVSRAGILLSALSIGWIAAVFIGGLVQDLVGVRRVLLVGMGLMMLAPLGVVLTPVWTLAVPAVVCMGLGFGLTEQGLNTSVSDAYPERRGWALNLLHAFIGVGALLAPLAVGLTARGGMSWRYVYLGIAAFGVVPFLILSRRRFPAASKEERPSFWTSFGYVLRQRRFLLAAAILGAYVGTEAIVSGWGFTYLVKYRGQSETFAGMALSLFWVGLLAGRLSSMWIVERMDYARLLTLAGFVSFLTVAATALLASPVPLAAGFVTTGFFFAPLFATTVALAQRDNPRHSGLVTGLLVTLGGLGGPICSWLGGQVSAWADLRVTMLLGALVALALTALAGVRVLHDRRRPAPR